MSTNSCADGQCMLDLDMPAPHLQLATCAHAATPASFAAQHPLTRSLAWHVITFSCSSRLQHASKALWRHDHVLHTQSQSILTRMSQLPSDARCLQRQQLGAQSFVPHRNSSYLGALICSLRKRCGSPLPALTPSITGTYQAQTIFT